MTKDERGTDERSGTPGPHPRNRDDSAGDEQDLRDGTVPAEDVSSDERTDEDAKPERLARPRTRFGARSGPALWVAAALVIGLGVVNYALFQRAEAAEAMESARDAASRAAGEAVPAVLSYNPETIGKYPAVAKSKTTGQFRTALGSLIEQTVLPAVQDKKITTKTEITGSSVIKAEGTSVSLLMFINQTTTSTDLPQPKLEGSRIRVTMQQEGDAWLVSRLEPV